MLSKQTKNSHSQNQNNRQDLNQADKPFFQLTDQQVRNKQMPTRNNNNIQHDNNFLSHCYSVIGQQQAYIQKLQRDNSRKDSIISNLLKNNGNKNNSKHAQNNVMNCLQVQQLIAKTEQQQKRLEQIMYQNECYQLQIQNKNKEIRTCIETARQQQARQNQLIRQIEEDKIYVSKLKQAYEAKIAKLLAEMKRKVEDDVLKMKIKTQTQTQDSSKTDSWSDKSQGKYQMETVPSSKRKENSIQNMMETPNKTNCKSKCTDNTTLNSFTNRAQSSSKKMIPSSQARPEIYSSRNSKLINTPYRYSSRMVPQNSQIISMSQIKQNKNDTKSRRQNKNNNRRMLNDIRDAQFVTDSCQDTETEQSSIINQIENDESTISYRYEQNKNNSKLISIQNVIKRYADCDEQLYHYSPDLLHKQICGHQYNRDTDKTGPKSKVTSILEQLSLKIKRFQNQHIQVP